MVTSEPITARGGDQDDRLLASGNVRRDGCRPFDPAPVRLGRILRSALAGRLRGTLSGRHAGLPPAWLDGGTWARLRARGRGWVWARLWARRSAERRGAIRCEPGSRGRPGRQPRRARLGTIRPRLVGPTR